jgi:PAS domain S-box-containing protein
LSGLFSSENWHFVREDGTPLPVDDYPVNKIIKSGKAFSNMVIGINHRESILWVLCNAYFINDKHQVVTVFADVSSLKEVEKELELSEELYKKAFMSSHDAIIITRMSDGMINSINTTFSILTGYTEEDLEGKTTIDINIWKNIEDRNKVVTDLKNGVEVKDFDTYFVGKDGRDIHGLSSYSTLILNGEVHILTSVKLICERSRNGRKEDKV